MCSGNKLKFVPGTGSDLIVNGVLDVRVPSKVAGKTASYVESEVNSEVIRLVGAMTKWEHVMYILPKSVDFNSAAAFAYIGWYRSVYSDDYSSDFLVLVHEIGHNLGKYHSGARGTTYGDGTCMMGSHLYDDEAPKSCFNGAKSWFFGWYSDRHAEINPVTSWEGKLVGIDDYLNNQIPAKSLDFHVIVKIGDLFMMYNRKEGVNAQVTEKGDMVTIVAQSGENQQSWLLGGFSEETDEFRSYNWEKKGNDLVIKVCDRVSGTPDYARVIVFLDDRINTLSCSASQSPTVSTSPTLSPTFTRRPSTIIPTQMPTIGTSFSGFHNSVQSGTISNLFKSHNIVTIQFIVCLGLLFY